MQTSSDQNKETPRQGGSSDVDGKHQPTTSSGAGKRVPTKVGIPPKSRQKGRKYNRSADRSSGQDALILDPSLYINRELSWLEFNQRVLQEVKDPRHPLFERLKFLSIAGSNLDEFFMIRVAGIKEQIRADITEYSPDGQSPSRQLHAIHDRASAMLKEMSDCFWKHLHPKLSAEGIHLLKMKELDPNDRAKVSSLFAREIYPVLTPLAFDPGHPFPYISNLSLSLAVVVSTPKGEERFARVKVPDVLPRLVQIPNGDKNNRTFRFVWLEDAIAENLNLLFPGMTIKESYAFRVTRNADMEIQEDEAEDLIHSIEESVRQRRFGSVVRVEAQSTMPPRIKDILVENLEVSSDDVYELGPPLNLSHLMSLLKLPRPELKDQLYVPASFTTDEDGEDVFSAVCRGDIVLHHPYDSFNPVVQFIEAAANDPNVLAIKQTLYRIGKESPLIPLFVQAAENGKQVAVLVELKARFDEENNIGWAKQLERAGVHVVYGLVGLKTHAKMALVVRREHDGIRRYVHLGTGNYNPTTARIYTDLSYFTCREEITEDATEVFNYLTGYSRRQSYKKLAVAPVTLREKLVTLIDREIQHAKSGKAGHMILKMNALTDVRMIVKLYEASKAGVRIDLIVRGICSLRPGVKGWSETVRVISIVGRYLEHSRVFYFENAGQPELYLSSADLMGRNLDRRVELMFPIEDARLAETIKREVLDAALAENVRAQHLHADDTYTFASPQNGMEVIDIQQKTMLSRTELNHTPKPVPREAPPIP